MTTHTLFCRRLPGRLLALLLAILLTFPSAAWADESAAAEFYSQATAAYQQGDYQKAADLLDLAFGAHPDLVYKYNRILALQALGAFDTALAELNTMYGPMKADSQNRFDDIEQIKTQIEAAIRARDTDKAPTDPPDPPPEQPAPSSDAAGPNIPAIALMGGGGLLLTTGLLFATAIFLPEDVKECLGLGTSVDCEDLIEDHGTAADSQDHAREVQTTHQIAAVSLISAGAIAAGIGVVLFVLDKDDDESTGVSSMRFTPYVTHEGGGAAVQFRF